MKCIVDNCEGQARVRGMCNKHRMRVDRYEERMSRPGVSFRAERPEMEAHRKTEYKREPIPGGDE